MLNDELKHLKDIELFMLAQFIDVIDIISQYNSIDEVKKDIRKRKKMYLDNIEKLSSSKDFWDLDLYSCNIDAKMEKCKELYFVNNECTDVHLAYKIGLIEGMKVKNKCT